MGTSSNGKGLDEIQEECKSCPSSNCKLEKNQIPFLVSTSQRGLLGEKSSKKSVLDKLKILPGRSGLMKFSSRGMLASPSAKFRRLAEQKDEISRQIPSSNNGFRERLRASVAKKIEWDSLMKICRSWIRDPMNMALLVWITCVAISGAILFLVMTGILNHALPKKSQRDTWFDVNNQILNALFTLMCLYHHPKRFYHLVLLIRWRPEDVLKLRKVYCKNGTYKPHEWMHMMVVAALLHLNCFAQYALCGLNLGFRRSERPAIGVGVCISVAIAAPAFAGVYTILSPLGRDYNEPDEEMQVQINSSELRAKSFEKRYSFVLRDDRRVVETEPQWSGGLFDLWDDISVAYLSLFCGFCVFGWNMDRLGFGNMYVHIATFLLFCMAPFWIFNLAAVNIGNETVREALSLTGFVLCIFGLLYGGFWRIQMRKRFHLPASNFCCGYPAVTDCAQWLCCCMCSLAQEVRTADFYDIEEDKFYRKDVPDGDPSLLSPLPREAGSSAFHSGPSSPQQINSSPPKFMARYSPSPSRLSNVEEGLSYRDETMKPPVTFSICSVKNK